MDIDKYIASGIIEEYCLGTASLEKAKELEALVRRHPKIQQELEANHLALENYVSGYTQKPRQQLKNQILGQLDDWLLEEALSSSVSGRLNTFIGISEKSDAKQWRRLIQGIHPPDNYDIHLHELYADPKKSLHLAWVRNEVPFETHEDEKEAFFILEGTCSCKIGHKIVHLKSGSFLDIPLHVAHNMQVTSKQPVVAIMSRVMVG